jgi:AGZA family xanthine/uracil permease-like MFS transporter
MTYTGLNALLYLTKVLSRGRIQPPDADLQDYWTWKPQGGHAPWFIRAAAQGGKFWDQKDERGLDKTDAVSEGGLARASDDKSGGSERLESSGSTKLERIMVRECY